MHRLRLLRRSIVAYGFAAGFLASLAFCTPLHAFLVDVEIVRTADSDGCEHDDSRAGDTRDRQDEHDLGTERGQDPFSTFAGSRSEQSGPEHVVEQRLHPPAGHERANDSSLDRLGDRPKFAL